MISRLACLIVLFGLAISCQAQCLSENDNPPTLKGNAAQVLADARFGFALDSLKKIIEIEPTENIFYSPHSLHEALSLVYFGAKRHTELSLKKALRIPQEFSKIDVQRFYAYEKSELEARKANISGNYEFRVANSLWFAKQKKIRQCMKDFFGPELEQVDFKSNPELVRKRINDWVSDVTKGNIRDLLPANSIDESTDTVLANAVYFKGFWQSRFTNSTKQAFYLGQDNMTIIPYMRQKGTFNYIVSDILGAHILQLPYKGDDISMYILLPPFVRTRSADSPREPNDGLRQLLYRLSNTAEGAQELAGILNENTMPSRDVDIAIPKFTLERDLRVKELLSAMDASPVIEPDTSDLTGFVADGEKSPYLGDAVHRARIELTEEGTTASAATALFSFRSSRPTEPAHFIANHPFVFFIYDNTTRTMLFAGVFRKPAEKQYY